MNKNGKSIIEAIKFLDEFYNDVGLMFSNFENLLSEKGISCHPDAGNRTTYHYDVSNHIGRSKKWTLKNIQRLYLRDEEIKYEKNDLKGQNINKAILCSLALYPSSAFDIPVFVCGVLKWDGLFTQKEIYNNWPTKEICELVKTKNIWRLKRLPEKGAQVPIYSFSPLDKFRNISDFSLFFVDVVKIENSAVLQQVVDALVELFNEGDEIVLNKDLIVDEIPEGLLKTWQQPDKRKEEE